MKDFATQLFEINQKFCQEVPSMLRTQNFVEDIINFLFPIRSEKHISIDRVKLKEMELRNDFKELLTPLMPNLKLPVDDIVERYFNKLPEIYFNLMEDSDMYHKSDPAAYCPEEVILCYPGYYAVAIYRLAHELYSLEIPVLPRVISEFAHSKTGVDIHPGAKIGKKFYIDHGTGIVIGETAEIGENVKIYQGVTLGALYVEKDLARKKRHPTIQDNVIIYSGGTVLGGNTVVGHDTVIGGNVWLTSSVQPFSVVYRKPKINIRDSKEFNEPINFSI